MGERALVTGASAGIGTAFARALAARGNDLVLVARDIARLESLAKELNEAHTIDAEVLPADLTDSDDLETIAQRLADDDAPVDLLVNNAGFGTVGRFHGLPFEPEQREIRLNVIALHRLTHAALGAMVDRGRGGVINVSSLGGYQPAPGFATYSATKAFVSSFTQAIHEELRGTGVKAMVVCPGFTRTEFQERADVDDSSVPDLLWQSAEQVVSYALKDYDRGRAVSIPGPINQATAAFATVVPGIVGRKISNAMMRRTES